MKIAYITGEFPAVSETFILNQMAGALENGFDIEIHALKPNAKAPVHDLVTRYGLMDKVHYRPHHPANRFMRLAAVVTLILKSGPQIVKYLKLCAISRSNPVCAGHVYLALAQSLRNSDADVIHCQFGHLAIPIQALRSVGLIHCRVVVSFRGGDTTILLKRHPGLYRFLYADDGLFFLPVSQSIANLHLAEGCSPEKLEVHHSGIALDRFAYRPAAILHHPVRLLAVGRMVEKKGHYDAIETVRLLKNCGVNVRLTLVGSGPLEEALRQQSIGLENYVTFTGWKPQEDVLDLLYKSDVLLAPCVTAADGDQEGIPNFIKEAMACGIPVISTFHAGIPELVEDGVSGLLVPERDPAALAGAVMRLTETPASIRPMVLSAREKMENEFDITKLNTRLMEIYAAAIRCAC